MKISLPLKLGVGVVALFAAVIAIMLVYKPLRYRYWTGRISSGIPGVRESTAKRFAEMGDTALPFVRKWLASDDDRLVEGACMIIKKTSDETWKKLLGDLEKILDRRHSNKTDAAAATLLARGFAWESEYESMSGRLSNMHRYLLGGPFPAEAQISRIRNLSSYPDPAARDALVAAVRNAEDHDGRAWAEIALGAMGDKESVELLIEKLANDRHNQVRAWAGEALGMMRDSRAKRPLMRALETDGDELVTGWSALMLARFEGGDVIACIEKNRDKAPDAAAAALAWLRDGDDLPKALNNLPAMADKVDNAADHALHDLYDATRDLTFLADVRWGNTAALIHFLGSFTSGYYAIDPFEIELKSWLSGPGVDTGTPEKGFPVSLYQNLNRLAWDAEKRRYYLKPEPEKPEKSEQRIR